MTLFPSLVLCAIVALSSPTASLALDRAVRVLDGDSLEIDGQSIRLFGIDAPERGQPCDRAGQVWDCGKWSRRMLAKAVDQGPVTCQAVDRDRYGRTVATCAVLGKDLGEWLVQNGAARAYTRYSRRYVGAEKQAKGAGLGIWATRMQSPETFRHSGQTAAPVAKATDGCRIKGNISSKGVKIYHRPGQRDYEATRISPRKGEAWFCSADEAEAAGFRAAKR